MTTVRLLCWLKKKLYVAVTSWQNLIVYSKGRGHRARASLLASLIADKMFSSHVCRVVSCRVVSLCADVQQQGRRRALTDGRGGFFIFYFLFFWPLPPHGSTFTRNVKCGEVCIYKIIIYTNLQYLQIPSINKIQTHRTGQFLEMYKRNEPLWNCPPLLAQLFCSSLTSTARTAFFFLLHF